MIEDALIDVGGHKYLTQQAIENPQAFLALLGKLLPRDVKATSGLHMSVELIGVQRRAPGQPGTPPRPR